MMFDRDIPGFNSPTPDEVDGYEQAKAANKIPVVPAEPPQFLPGVTARQDTLRRVYIFLAGFALTVVLGALFKQQLDFLIVVPVAAAMIWFFIGALKNRQLVLAETRAGYATQKIIATNVSAGSSRKALRATRLNSGRIGWDFGGVWYMKPDGRVISAPDRTKFAPGYYPSPNYPGRFELWTGYAWTGVTREPGEV